MSNYCALVIKQIKVKLSKSISFLTINVKKRFEYLFSQQMAPLTLMENKHAQSVRFKSREKAGNFESKDCHFLFGYQKKKYPGNVLVSNDLQCAFGILVATTFHQFL